MEDVAWKVAEEVAGRVDRGEGEAGVGEEEGEELRAELAGDVESV